MFLAVTYAPTSTKLESSSNALILSLADKLGLLLIFSPPFDIFLGYSVLWKIQFLPSIIVMPLATYFK